ncbi:MAG: 23S rRNA (adenine(2503)-C(2))-methyltransferase RlmN [Desulfobacterales bacterium]
MSIENDSAPNRSPEDPADLLNFSLEALIQWLDRHGVAAYRGRQILKWIYRRDTTDFEAMTDLNKPLRRMLADNFRTTVMELVDEQRSRDGSRKFLFRLADGNHIETILIPERGHSTLCISSQVGCALGCRFCRTGQGGLVRNLTQGEILSQIREVHSRLDKPSSLTNIVFMGMGEPLSNYIPVTGSLAVMTDSEWGMAFSPRRVTLSTAGIVPRLKDLGKMTQVNLAISLNAADDTTRNALMPINKTYPLESLLEACRSYPLAPRRRITFEYILMEGVNDDPPAARKLCKILRPIRAKINLIPFNPHPGSDFKRPSPERIAAFQQILLNQNYPAMVRHSKGDDIAAACGQLWANAEAGQL